MPHVYNYDEPGIVGDSILHAHLSPELLTILSLPEIQVEIAKTKTCQKYYTNNVGRFFQPKIKDAIAHDKNMLELLEKLESSKQQEQKLQIPISEVEEENTSGLQCVIL